MGISRTLMNVFSRHQPEALFVISRDSPSAFELGEAWAPWQVPPNIVGRVLTPLFGALSLSSLDRALIVVPSSVEAFAPDLIVVSGSSIECLFAAKRLSQRMQVALVSYFMDDLRMLDSRLWWRGTGKGLLSWLLSESRGVLFISAALQEAMSTRYDAPKRSLIVHSTVCPAEFRCVPPRPITDRLKVLYAGSLWGMHFDAVELCASVVDELQQSGLQVELEIYTPSIAAAQHLSEYRGVTVHPAVPYEEIPAILGSSDVLLVAASFLQSNHHLAFSSLQTKLIDYMAAGRVVLSVGPQSGACSRFVVEHSAGFIAASKEEVHNALVSLLKQPSYLIEQGRKNRRKAEEEFSQDTVLPKVAGFLNECLD